MYSRDDAPQYKDEYEEVYHIDESDSVSPALNRADSFKMSNRNRPLNQTLADKQRNLSSTAGYSPPGENLLPRNHVIGSRARYEMQMLDATTYRSNKSNDHDSNTNLFSLFKRSRRPSDKHKEFVDMLQFPKGNK